MSDSGKQGGAAARLPDATAGSDPLRRLKSGETTLDEYLDYRADLGVAHLAALLDSEQLSLVRETIREHLASDPVLEELVAAATGLRPAPTPGG